MFMQPNPVICVKKQLLANRELFEGGGAQLGGVIKQKNPHKREDCALELVFPKRDVLVRKNPSPVSTSFFKKALPSPPASDRG